MSYIRTKEHRKLMSRIKKGNSDKSKEEKIKISNTLKRRFADNEIVHPMKGKKWPELSGKNNPMYGKKRPDLALRNKLNPMKGKDNPAWINGNSFLPYSYKFTKSLKRKIWKRDSYTCQECNEQILKQTKRKFITVHHIDYDKQNCEEENLISLCNYCNVHANFNREDWVQKFKQKMEVIMHG